MWCSSLMSTTTTSISRRSGCSEVPHSSSCRAAPAPCCEAAASSDIVEVEPGDEEQMRGITIRATHAEHDSRRGPFGAETPALGYLVSGSASTYFAGDTDLFAGMGSIADDLDLALLPVAGWGPRLPPGHLNPRTAAEALALLRPRIAVPIHWGTYRRLGLTRDPLKVARAGRVLRTLRRRAHA